ncbi:hypothetical protein Q3O60_01680 [Alkalimonas collagenimarina]|uniref:Alpha/beta hydrolase n=1 Tax=Alkalimonas collagenimarina TaxID=400390 RepID=A0ABT9GV36_9GAMM|nr:hypothetical protein [Alkalimonas collagenimarina]MDP4534896.1 hypothetical protein [Alkalimonas collagenimarina]
MQFYEFGDPEGTALVFFMGTPQRGEAGEELSELAKELHIRLICPTRPWYDDQQLEPSFEVCSNQTLQYLQEREISFCHAMGGSGGGPFALHFSANNPAIVKSCYLLASMGTPSIFVEKVSSPPTLQLLSLMQEYEYQQAIEQLGLWGVPQDLAHGAWADFKVLLGSWSAIPLNASPMVYFHHGEGDENAPIESVLDLATQLPKHEFRVSPYASHEGMAEDESCTEIAKIFREINTP